MGIRGLNSFLKKHCPSVYRTSNLADYGGKRIAIDTMLFLYKYKASGGDRWLHSFASLVHNFRRAKITPVFVFDGKPPDLKSERLEERRRQRMLVEQRATRLRNALEECRVTRIINDVLREYLNTGRGTKRVRILTPTDTTERAPGHDDDDAPRMLTDVDIQLIEGELDRLERQSVYVSGHDIEMARKFLHLAGEIYLNAPSEAETLCCQLACHQMVDAVLSNDSDVLVYGTPICLSNLMRDGSVTEIHAPDVWRELDMRREQFLDMAILFGTDYNRNIPRIGPERASALITTHGSLEEIARHTTLDTDVLRYDDVRELFDIPFRQPQVEFRRYIVDVDALSAYMVTHQCGKDVIALFCGGIGDKPVKRLLNIPKRS